MKRLDRIIINVKYVCHALDSVKRSINDIEDDNIYITYGDINFIIKILGKISDDAAYSNLVNARILRDGMAYALNTITQWIESYVEPSLRWSDTINYTTLKKLQRKYMM